MTQDLSGFWELVENISFSKDVTPILAATCDRFLESRFFLQKILRLVVAEEYLAQANWLFSAHLAATISLWDAAKYDFRQANKSDLFDDSHIGKEFFLSSTASDPIERDPIAFNRAYRDLRNLRIHHGLSIVRYGEDVLLSEFLRQNDLPSGQWYFKAIEVSRHNQLRTPQLSSSELQQFNEFVYHKPAISLASQHLYILYRSIMDTAKDTFGIS